MKSAPECGELGRLNVRCDQVAGLAEGVGVAAEAGEPLDFRVFAEPG